MPIPIPKLDDLSFDQLMAEARALIPRYAPQWTDHNVSDPGIMLLDLFAWLSETFMFRADQVTDKQVEAFLRLIGRDKTDAESLRAAVIDAALSIKERQRAIIAGDYEYLALKRMDSILPGLGGRAAVMINRNLDLKKDYDAERLGYASVLVFPNDPITEELYKKIEIYVKSGINGNWTAGELIIVHNIDARRMACIDSLFAFIDSDANRLFPSSIRDIMEALKLTLIDRFAKYLKDGVRGEIDDRLADKIDAYIRYLIVKIKAVLCNKDAFHLPSAIADYIEHRKQSIVDRFINLLRGKPSKRKIYDDNAERIREEIRKNIRSFLDFGKADWTKDKNLIDDLAADLNDIGNDMAAILLHQDKPDFHEHLIKAMEQFRVAAKNAVHDFMLFNTESVEFLELLDAFKDFKDRLKQTIKKVLFPGTEVQCPVQLPPELEDWLKKIRDDILKELHWHVTEAIIDEVRIVFEAARLLTHRVHVVKPLRFPVGIRVTMEIGKTAVWENVRASVADRICKFIDPISGGPAKNGWPIGRSLYVSELCQVVEGGSGIDHVVSITLHKFISDDPKRINEEQINNLFDQVDQAEGDDARVDSLISRNFETGCDEVPLSIKTYFAPLLHLQERRTWV